MIHVIVFYLVLIGVGGLAVTAGGAPERIAAALMTAATVVTALVPYDRNQVFASLDWAGLGLDLVMLAAFTAIALRANRYWPIWLAALQLLSVAIHIIRAIDESLVPLVYAWSTGQIAYPMIVLVGIGAWRHRQRLRRWGDDPAWSGHERAAPPSPLACS